MLSICVAIYVATWTPCDATAPSDRSIACTASHIDLNTHCKRNDLEGNAENSPEHPKQSLFLRPFAWALNSVEKIKGALVNPEKSACTMTQAKL
jgi:hypothetical protein